MEQINAVGRRKTSVARVYLKQGSGNITINQKDVSNYFPMDIMRIVLKQPLTLLESESDYDIKINVRGGGYTGQAEAARLGIARALCQVDEENRSTLKKEKLLTRDPRMVERKKYGKRKARRSFQFSKR